MQLTSIGGPQTLTLIHNYKENLTSIFKTTSQKLGFNVVLNILY